MEKEKTMKELLNFSIINIDKPTGPTSFSISDFVRQKLSKFGIKKTSHFGTLDPKVTGVLPIALGRACKLTGFFLGENKTYVGIMHVHKEISVLELQKVINEKFIGKIKQMPPRKSAVKRAEREREIIGFKILEKNDKDFLFSCEVQGGTYIRKLIDDLGKEINGAHMLELRRTQAGIFNEDDRMIDLYEFEKLVDSDIESLRKVLIPGEEAISKIFEVVEVKKDKVKDLLIGKPFLKEDLVKIPKQERFAVFSSGRFIEIAEKCYVNYFARPLFVFN